MRELKDIITHIRTVVANPAVKTTLIQTEDLIALCDAAETNAVAPPVEGDVLREYDANEKRVSDYLQEITNGQIGSGDDPIGFLIASHHVLSTRAASVSAIDFAKEANDLKQALADNAYPAADGTADIDNHALPIIEVTLRNLVERALSQKNGTTTDRSEGDE